MKTTYDEEKMTGFPKKIVLADNIENEKTRSQKKKTEFLESLQKTLLANSGKWVLIEEGYEEFVPKSTVSMHYYNFWYYVEKRRDDNNRLWVITHEQEEPPDKFPTEPETPFDITAFAIGSFIVLMIMCMAAYSLWHWG